MRTKPKNEERAKRNLENGGFEVLAPKIRYRKLKDGTIKEVIEEMFPGYIFVRFFSISDYRKVKYTRGVKDVVRFGNKIVPVEENVIEFIKRRLKNGIAEVERRPINSGDRVIITEGPFKGIVGIFEKELKPAERVSILLEGLNYYARMIIHRELITPYTGSSGS
ncbi:MAG: transcription termination/antitermination NusG family protein [Deltaproteobacteria bacterium]|nr:transcription termination/antitermination NusG family protein [Deltaproteobacteria bacterium]